MVPLGGGGATAVRDGGRAQVSLYPEAGLLVSYWKLVSYKERLPLSFFLHSVCVLSWGLALRTELRRLRFECG